MGGFETWVRGAWKVAGSDLPVLRRRRGWSCQIVGAVIGVVRRKSLVNTDLEVCELDLRFVASEVQELSAENLPAKQAELWSLTSQHAGIAPPDFPFCSSTSAPLHVEDKSLSREQDTATLTCDVNMVL